jgi:hypothetical protein
MTLPASRIADEIMRQVEQRGVGKSICPSEVARALMPAAEGAWQSLMVPVRRAAVALALEGRIDILRKGKPAQGPDAIKGVIRLRRR